MIVAKFHLQISDVEHVEADLNKVPDALSRGKSVTEVLPGTLDFGMENDLFVTTALHSLSYA